jgi:hypothetical protein
MGKWFIKEKERKPQSRTEIHGDHGVFLGKGSESGYKVRKAGWQGESMWISQSAMDTWTKA